MTDNLPTERETIPLADLIAYRKKNLTLEEIAKLTGCTRQNVQQRFAAANLEGLERFQEHKDRVLEAKQSEIVNQLTDAKVKGMSGLQLITGAAILEDKIRAIRGQASEIIDHRHLVVDLGKAIEAMRAEQSSIDAQYVDNPVEQGTYQPHCPQVKT